MQRSREDLFVACSDPVEENNTGPTVAGSVIKSLRDSGVITSEKAVAGRKSSVKKMQGQRPGVGPNMKIDESGSGLPTLNQKEKGGAAAAYAPGMVPRPRASAAGHHKHRSQAPGGAATDRESSDGPRVRNRLSQPAAGHNGRSR